MKGFVAETVKFIASSIILLGLIAIFGFGVVFVYGGLTALGVESEILTAWLSFGWLMAMFWVLARFDARFRR